MTDFLAVIMHVFSVATFAALIPYAGPLNAGATGYELLLFALLGAVLGVLAAAFVWLNSLLVRVYRKLQPSTPRGLLYAPWLLFLRASVRACAYLGC